MRENPRYGKILDIFGKEGDSSLFANTGINKITNNEINTEETLATQAFSEKRELQKECRILFLKEENKLILF
jgi:hypothetical protein